MLDKINRSTFITEDGAKLLLRLAVGVVVLLHGIFKLQNPGALDFVAGAFTNFGLPGALAYLVYIGEVLAPLLMMVGYQTKLAALLISINMLVALLLVHTGELFSRNAMGGWSIELQAMILFGALAVFGLGAGKHVLMKK